MRYTRMAAAPDAGAARRLMILRQHRGRVRRWGLAASHLPLLILAGCGLGPRGSGERRVHNVRNGLHSRRLHAWHGPKGRMSLLSLFSSLIEGSNAV